MSLFIATIILVSGISLFFALPLVFRQIKNYSIYFFLVGTGAMTGICFFDLLPEVYEMGGYSSVFIIIISCVIYFLIHFFTHKHHEHSAHLNSGAFFFFLASLCAHNFASGMLLAISYDLSLKIANAVFSAMVAHKGYEAMMLASIFVQQPYSNLKKLKVASVYIFALPMGVALSKIFENSFNKQVAIIVSGIAVGTLMGCLIFDFLWPSFKQLKEKPMHLIWIASGFFLTQIIDFYKH